MSTLHTWMKFFVKPTDLMPTSTVKVNARCDYCGRVYRVQYFTLHAVYEWYGRNYCNSCNISRSKKVDISVVMQKFVSKGYVPLFDVYTKSKQKLPYYCLKHPYAVQQVTYDKLSNDKGCKWCGLEKRSGKNHPSWKGGITTENSRLRNSTENRYWRDSVFGRDNYTCQKCGSMGKTLNAHHIISWSIEPSSRFLVDNGITLCKECHKSFHKKYGSINTSDCEIRDFILNDPV